VYHNRIKRYKTIRNWNLRQSGSLTTPGFCPSYKNTFNITAKAALKFGSEAWVLKKREEQRLEAAQMKFLRHLGITKLDKEKKTNVLGKKQEHRI